MNAHRVRLEPAQLAVEPGADATCTVRIWNTGDVVDAYAVEVLGPAAAWTDVEPATVSLFPGSNGVALLTFRPPRTPDALAGKSSRHRRNRVADPDPQVELRSEVSVRGA